jgi:hypothetical protein
MMRLQLLAQHEVAATLRFIAQMLTLVANSLPPLGTHDFMRLTSVEEWGFCEFATSVNVGIRPNGIKLSSNTLLYQCFGYRSASLGSPQASLGQRVTA